MGIISWVGAGLAAFVLAQMIPHGRGGRTWKDALVALAASIMGGMAATALDFGGWKVVEWRAAAFAFLAALAILGLLRIIRSPLDVS